MGSVAGSQYCKQTSFYCPIVQFCAAPAAAVGSAALTGAAGNRNQREWCLKTAEVRERRPVVQPYRCMDSGIENVFAASGTWRRYRKLPLVPLPADGA